MTTRAEQEAMDGSAGRVTKQLEDLAADGTYRGCGISTEAEPGRPVIDVLFQVGPIGEVGVNGCAIEDVIDVLIARLEGFQRGPFACAENLQALRYLDWAKRGLLVSTAARRAQGVEGTNQPHQGP